MIVIMVVIVIGIPYYYICISLVFYYFAILVSTWRLVINPVVPGRGTGPGRQKSPKCRAGPAGVLGRPCGTGPGYGAGSAKIAEMPGWARGGAGPAPRARRGPCWSRRGCGPVQFELLPGYRAEPAKI